MTCFSGYDLFEGDCVFAASNTARPTDLGCATWDWTNQECLSCSDNWAFNANKNCVPVSDQCAAHDASGACTKCFKGYDLSEGKCLFSASNNAQTSDLGCGTWDWDNQVCLKCSNGWVFNTDKKCVAVSDQCKTHLADGSCESCYAGYDLADGKCIFSESNNAKPADLGCGTWDWKNQKCLNCANRWAFNAAGKCIPVADQCRTYNADGNCGSCYKGYDLADGKCIFSESNNAKPSDLGCGTWDWDNQVCLKCSNGWVFNPQKVCVAVSNLCANHNEDGTCSECYKGYDLKNGGCIFSDSNNAKPSDLGCGTWDWDNQVCLKCSNHWVFNQNKICVPVSDQCKESDNAGECTSCYKGYDLADGKCVFSPSNNAKPSDLGCATWDWDNQVCLQCSHNWVFNAEKKCFPVSDQC